MSLFSRKPKATAHVCASPCDHKGKTHISFAGGAVVSFFNVGVASWMIKNVDRDEISLVHGVSGGALCGAWLLCAPDAQSFHFTTNQYIAEWDAQVERMGGHLALGRSLAYHRSLLERSLPENAHELCSNRLSIALTNLRTRRIETVSFFESRDYLIDVLIASMTIPMVNAVLPARVKGKRYIDAGFLANQVICCEEVLVCSPFKRLNMPWTRSAFDTTHSLMGEYSVRQAFNPYTDVRKQVRLGLRFAQEFFLCSETDAGTEPGERISLAGILTKGVTPDS
jgi:hypothetical protein